jgi:hypothetical protein
LDSAVNLAVFKTPFTMLKPMPASQNWAEVFATFFAVSGANLMNLMALACKQNERVIGGRL